MEESGIMELEISEGEESVRINRGSPAAGTVQYSMPAPQVAPSLAVAYARCCYTCSCATASDELSGHIIRSPTVGNFLS